MDISGKDASDHGTELDLGLHGLHHLLKLPVSGDPAQVGNSLPDQWMPEAFDIGSRVLYAFFFIGKDHGKLMDPVGNMELEAHISSEPTVENSVKGLKCFHGSLLSLVLTI